MLKGCYRNVSMSAENEFFVEEAAQYDLESIPLHQH